MGRFYQWRRKVGAIIVKHEKCSDDWVNWLDWLEMFECGLSPQQAAKRAGVNTTNR